MLLPFLPDLLVLLGLFAVLAEDILGPEPSWRRSSWITATALGAVLIVLPFTPAPGATDALPTYAVTTQGLWWRGVFAAAGMFAALLAPLYGRSGGAGRSALTNPGAYMALLLSSVLGMGIIVSSQELLTFFLGIELATIPLYALVAFQAAESRGVEGASKYVVLGLFAAALLLFGISLLYGAAGSLSFEALESAAESAAATGASATPILHAGVLFVMAGLLFKMAAAPLHMWTPDVYEGAPTPVTAFLAAGSKAGGAGALALLFFGPLAALRPALASVFAAVAIASMVAGNLGALRQRNLRRFIAYSSIAQAGFLLLAFLGNDERGQAALLYNLLAYGVTLFAAFFVIGAVSESRDERFADLHGLSAERPELALALLLAMFSLAGMPPLAGFLGKFLLFSAVAERGHYWVLAIALANGVLSLYYYLLVVKAAWITPPEPAADSPPFAARRAGTTAALAVLVAAIILLGVWPGLLEALMG